MTALYQQCRSTFAGFMHPEGTKTTFEDSREERLALYEELLKLRGFAKLFSNYSDLLVDPKANAEFSEFLADKIRARVNDPETAEKLIPKDHGYAMKRPPMETGYYEAYNLPTVHLVDLKAEPILRITETGVETPAGEQEFDIIIWATGFDAVTGALTRMGIVGVDGEKLTEFWADGPRTYLGVTCPRFPNLLFLGGPHTPFANIPRGVEDQVDFVTGLVKHVTENGYERVETDESAEEVVDRARPADRGPLPRGRLVVVQGGQHPRQGRPLPALPRRTRQLPREGRRGRGQWIRRLRDAAGGAADERGLTRSQPRSDTSHDRRGGRAPAPAGAQAGATRRTTVRPRRRCRHGARSTPRRGARPEPVRRVAPVPPEMRLTCGRQPLGAPLPGPMWAVHRPWSQG